MVSRRGYVSERGDVVWLTFSPQVGHEQSGRRPGVVVSPSSYNGKTGMALCCPITTQVKGYPFEVLIPPGHKVSGAILSDHIKNIDLKARKAEYCCKLPGQTIKEIADKVTALLSK